MPNPARGKMLTQCAECGRVVSVTKDYYIIVPGVEARGRLNQWRAVTHGKPRCLGSRVIVPEAVVFPRQEIA